MTTTTQPRATVPETAGDHPTAATPRRTWHAGVWLVWALAAAACIQLAPNPVYVALVIGIASVVVSIHSQPGPYAKAFPLLLAVGAFFAVVRMLLTVATTHGVGDILFTTPHFGLPQLLGGFTVGGTVELQIMLQSL